MKNPVSSHQTAVRLFVFERRSRQRVKPRSDLEERWPHIFPARKSYEKSFSKM